MMRKVVGVLVLVFVIFFVYSQPRTAGDLVQAGFDLVLDLFDRFVRFVNAAVN